MFIFRGGPGGDDSHIGRVGADLQIGMDYQQELAVLRLTQGDPTLFAFTVLFIRNGDHQWVMKNRGSLFVTDPMLAPVVGGPGWIPFKVKLIHRFLTKVR